MRYLCNRMTKYFLQHFILFLCALLTSVGAMGETRDSKGQVADTTGFVKASVMVFDPGDALYAVFGHTVLHMECPSKGLDYCFTFETEPNPLKFFVGQAQSCFIAVPTETFLAPYRKERRGAVEYELNLTDEEKRELWRALDEDMMSGPSRQFNLIRDNCNSMSMTMVESIMMNEDFVFTKMPHQLSFINGPLLRYESRRSPWAQFLFITFLGAEADTTWKLENRLSPTSCVELLQHASIKNAVSGTSRPALIGQPRRVLPSAFVLAPSPFSPVVVFGGLLIFVILFTLVEWVSKGRLRRAGHCLDVTLFVLQTLAGFFLLYVTLVTNLFGLHWNWYLLVFNPVPLVVWLCCRRRTWYRKVYWVYGAVLVVTIVALPLITLQADVAHELLMLGFLPRVAMKCRKGH